MGSSYILQRIFEGYVRNFSTFRWYTNSNNSDITSKELFHLSDLGERLGYIVRREMNWHFPRDLCWVEDLGKESVPFLYVERESNPDRLVPTIEKMTNVENSGGIPYLVASFGFLKPGMFEQGVHQFQEALSEDQTALIYAWIAERENAPKWAVRAAIISTERVIETEAVPSITEDSYWSIRFSERHASWR